MMLTALNGICGFSMLAAAIMLALHGGYGILPVFPLVVGGLNSAMLFYGLATRKRKET